MVLILILQDNTEILHKRNRKHFHNIFIIVQIRNKNRKVTVTTSNNVSLCSENLITTTLRFIQQA